MMTAMTFKIPPPENEDDPSGPSGTSSLPTTVNPTITIAAPITVKAMAIGHASGVPRETETVMRTAEG